MAVLNNYSRVIALRRALRRRGASAVVGFGEQTNVLVLLATLGTGVRRVISERTDPTRHKVRR